MNIRNYLATALLLLCLHTANTASAQHTGSYDTTIAFMSANRAVSVYVPPAYAYTTPCRLMVCLHGLGDTCSSYRNALISGYGWSTAMTNTIFVCPESSTRNADYFFPAGSEAIIQACIDFARASYNIDTADILLQGFSLGGRAALRYGLNNYSRFKGLLLNTPAVQGVKEAINKGAYTFNYANAAHIPITITHGATDVIYAGPIDSAYRQLIVNDGIVQYTDFAGLGHALPPTASVLKCLAFLYSPAAPGYDLHVVAPLAAPRSCVATVPAGCLVRNTGAKTLHSFSLSYADAAGPHTYAWTGSLAPFQHTTVTFPALAAAIGTNTLTVTVASVETGLADTITANNSVALPYQVQTTGLPVPYFEGFEGATFPPAGWVACTAGDIYAAFDIDNDVKKTGTGSMYAFNTIFIFDNAGRHEDVAMPLMDLTGTAAPYLAFDVAYNYHHYAPPTAIFDSSFADTLSVAVSTDCGDTYTTLYKKGGADLATFDSPILNPLSVNADFIHPADSNWRGEEISLAPYVGNDKVMIRFTYTSSLGGSINIDNVSVGNRTLSVPVVAEAGYKLFPNPAAGIVHISANAPIDAIDVTDIAGRVLLSLPGSTAAETTVNTAALPNGIYLFRLTTANGMVTKKVVIKQ